MNPAAELAKKRWEKATKKDRKKQAEILAAVRATVSPEQRSEIARKAAQARWAKAKKSKKK